MKRRGFWVMSLISLVVTALALWWLLSDFDMFARPNRIGVIEVSGVIDDVQDTLKDLVKFRKDPKIKAILIRVESPGGAVAPAQEIYREIRRTAAQKPVVASLGGTAASGGYYIASATNRIVANPGTVTGSIGVIVHFPNLQGLFEKIGYDMTTIKSGQFKDIGNPGREMTPEEKTILQETINEVQTQFIEDVARGRNLPEKKVQEIADGRILTGKKALQLGLVDELGNFEDAVAAAAGLGGVEGEPKLVYGEKKRLSLLQMVLGSKLSRKVNGYWERPSSFLRYQAPFGLE